SEAHRLFAHIPPLAHILETLVDVGLGYLALGQPATTLSGGEAQRVKLSRELAKRSTGRTLYLLDAPTTGLHFAAVKNPLEVLSGLGDAGNTVVVIEHNLDVIKTADWVIDLGPEGGARGGELVAVGTPEQVAEASGSYTGQFLGKVLSGSRGRRRRTAVAWIGGGGRAGAGAGRHVRPAPGHGRGGDFGDGTSRGPRGPHPARRGGP